MTVYLPLVALSIYPIIALLLVRRLEFPVARRLSTVLLGVNLATIWCAVLHIHTVWPFVNTIMVTLLYFNLCLAIGVAFKHRISFTKMTGMLFMVLVFGLGYLVAFYGWIGVRSIKYGQKEITGLQNGITVERTPIGNDAAQYRGLKVEVYKEVDYLPILKVRVADKSYYDAILPYCKPLIPNYDVAAKKVMITCGSFADTLEMKSNGHLVNL